jgi:hypothetical protein
MFDGGCSPCKETTTPTLTRVELDGDEELLKELDEEFTEGTKTAEIWGM